MCNGELVNEGGGETRMGFHLTPELSELYYPLPNMNISKQTLPTHHFVILHCAKKVQM